MSTAITDWKETGDQIAVMGDINHDIDSRLIRNMFSDLDLVDAISLLHDDLPETCVHNHSKRRIDGIWITSGLEPIRSGYTDYGMWDHRTPWIDLRLVTVFGYSNYPTQQSFSGRRLKLNNPSALQNYKQLYTALVTDHNLALRTRLVREELYYHETKEGFDRLEVIDKQRCEFMKKADKQCRRIFKGERDYSLELSTAAATWNFWKSVKS